MKKSVKFIEKAVEREVAMMEIDDASSSPSALQLADLPDKVLTMPTGQYPDIQSKARLSATSRGFHLFFKEDLKKAAVEKLNTHILRGEENEALALIGIRPERLLMRATAVDYSGRTFKVTPFQAALLEHDVQMWQKIMPLFSIINTEDFNAEKEIASQFNEIFPNGLSEQKPYDFSALIQIINISTNEDVQTLLDNPLGTTSPLSQAMKAFREDFTTTSMNETFFNPQHLIKAFDVYVQLFNPWSVNQLRLFWNQVIGYIQRFLPACYAQAFCQGLYDVVENNKPVARSLKFENNSRLYFPVMVSAGLGFEFGVYSYYRGMAGAWVGECIRTCGGWTHDGQSHLKNYVEQILQSYSGLNDACVMSDSPLQIATP